MTRRPSVMFEQDAADALIHALEDLGLHSEVRRTANRGPDLVVEAGGTRFVVEVKSVVTSDDGRRIARRRPGEPSVLVADRISEDARSLFRKRGVNFFDRRGELRIVEPPLFIDAAVPVAPPSRRPTSPLLGQVVKEVAIACLLTPDREHGVREVARYVDRAPSAVSKAMAELRDEGLLTSRGEPAVPDLFHELVTVWRRRPVALADVPQRGRGRANAQLELGLDDPEGSFGWALTDTRAASSYGMPVVARGDYPPDFYVPSEAVLRRARSLLGEATSVAARACTVAVAPVRVVCLRRVGRVGTSGEVWPAANHIVVALDLAQDTARGLEILDQWHPDGIVRAW